MSAELVQLHAEKAFGDALQERLEAEGYAVSREVPVPGGRIDILALRGPQRLIIEAKADANRASIRDALGQLLMYGWYAGHGGEATLCFAAPERPAMELLPLLGKYGIKVITVPPAPHDGGDPLWRLR
jgi:Holliday junction resolvase